jgi:pimeloyl-ACP methyl ester carboxylesterase
MRCRALPLMLLAFLLSSAGCARLASMSTARLMVEPPNRVEPRTWFANFRPLREDQEGFDDRFWVRVGPPPAKLLVSAVDPKPADRPPVGTILLLHGAYERSENKLNAANAFAEAGYRAVLVDMRGHGRSTGERITYGVQESSDLVQVVDALEQRGLRAGRLGVYGFSFGAATAIELAGRDPRVHAVVAVAPYSSLRDAASHLLQTKIPGASLFASERWIECTMEEAGRHGGFDPRAATPIAAIRRTEAMVLLIHGGSDRFVPPDHSVLLNRAAPDHSRVSIIEGADHNDLARDRKGTAASLAIGWFNRWMLDGPQTSVGLAGCLQRR